MRHSINASVESGTSTVVIAVDKCLTVKDHTTIGLFAPAILALVGKLPFEAWFDDEEGALVLKQTAVRA